MDTKCVASGGFVILLDFMPVSCRLELYGITSSRTMIISLVNVLIIR